MAAYYNENDPKTAAWLKALIKAGLIADGEVDTRSIVDVSAGDVRGFVQCHFFAGIGGWSYALRLAGWNDAQEVWTGSCPCQPWSMAGEGQGTDDPRHLWPAWFRLIAECRPAAIFGEQSASLDGLYWLDLVYADLEASDYAVGTADISGACLGSPDIRPRLWFVAHAAGEGLQGRSGRRIQQREPASGRNAGGLGNSDRERREGEPVHLQQRGSQPAVSETSWGSATGGMAHTQHAERRAVNGSREDGQQRPDAGREEAHGESRARGEVRWLADTDAGGQRINGRAAGHGDTSAEPHVDERGEVERLAYASGEGRTEFGWRWQQSPRLAAAGLLGGFWSDAEWVYCRPEPRYPEGCWRPVEPGSFPLVAGVPARILRLRGYGNSIKPHVAAAFIQAAAETLA